MELKKFLRSLGLSEQFITTKSRVFSGFGLGVIASVLLLTVLFLNHPLKASLLYPVVQGFSSTKSPLVSWPFQFSSRNKTAQEGILKQVSKNSSFTGFNDGNLVSKKSHSGNFTGNEKNITVMVVEKTYQGNLSREVNSTNSSFVDRNKEKNVTDRGESGRSNNGTKESVIESGHEQNLTKEHILTSSFNDSGIGNDDFEKCDIFDGRWVRDDKKPLYPAGSCPHIDRDFDCHLNGRPDEHFVKWRWQPNHCNIPSLNATDFLERLRGKRLVFVGDSLNRNMWESLVCILRHSVTDKKKVYEISGKKEFKKKGFYAFHYEDYNCSIDFVSSPFLVRESSTRSTNGLTETLRLDLMDRTAPMYHDAEIIVFNTGHWWTHEKTSKGENYYQEGKHVYPRLKVMEAYTKALTTWSRWIDSNVDVSKTQVFFRGYSVTHFRGGQWNSGGQCHKEFEPIYNDTYLAKYPAKMKALESVMRRMKTPVAYLNISKLSDYRKDAHPSIYRKEYKTLEEKIEAERSQDCSHWCLPGVPDTWNELLYASLLKIGRGSWRR